MFQRSHLQVLTDRIAEKRKSIFVLTGPRQVGKTTLIRQLLEKDLMPTYFVSADDASDPASETWIDQQWEKARLMLKNGSSESVVLIIDEIQQIKEWSRTIKRNWDSDTLKKLNVKVILLGSAQMLLQKGLSESLGGRFEVIPVNHWQFAEMQSAFGVTANEYAWFGGYPGAAELMKDEYRWKDYVNNALIETTLFKDILLLNRIDKPSLLRQLFDLACNYSGQILSFNKILGQLQEAGNSSTLTNYLHLLSGAGFVSGIPKYYKDTLHQKNSIPKLQVLNTAFIAARSTRLYEKVTNDPVEWGRVVESAVGAHILNSMNEGRYKTYYWRERNDEVDFVLQKDEKIIGLEVKSGNTNKAKGIAAFQKYFNPDKVYMVGNSGILWEDFLKMNPGELF